MSDRDPAAPAPKVSTDPRRHEDELGGRRYAIPFERVWRSALEVARSLGWEVTVADAGSGLLRAVARSRLLHREDLIEVRIRLDEDAQTRVDLGAGPRRGRFDLGRNRRRIRRFVRRLDRELGADERTILSSGGAPIRGGGVLSLLLALAAAAGCGEAAPPPEPASVDTTTASTEVERPLERRYERALAFRATGVDTTLTVTWIFEHDARTGRTGRRARGWLLRGESWDPFFDSLDVAPAVGAPWRPIPLGPLRLVVGEGDQIARIAFREGSRSLELRIEEPGPLWTGARGGTFHLLGGSVVLGDRRVEGRILDLSRALLPDEGPPGDWLFLVSGDSLAVILQAPVETREENGFQGWALHGDREFLWPEVTLDWADVRPFDRARREVPVAWTIRSAEGELTGVIELRSSQLTAGVGEGPLLPVDGLFEVSGTVVIDGEEVTVRGLLRHQQGRRLR